MTANQTELDHQYFIKSSVCDFQILRNGGWGAEEQVQEVVASMGVCSPRKFISFMLDIGGVGGGVGVGGSSWGARRTF